MDTAYLKRVAALVLGVLLSIGIILYIGYHAFHAVTSQVRAEPASEVTVTVNDDASVYIMRSEIPVYSASRSVNFVPMKFNGEKVSRGDAVCGIYDRADAASRTGLAEIDSQIRLLQDSLDSGLSVKDTSRLDSEIYTLMDRIRNASSAGRLSDAAGLRSELVSLYNKRLVVTGGSSSIASQLDSLYARRTELLTGMGTLRETVSVSQPGYYYWEADGYETVFDASLIDKMTYDDFSRMTSSAALDGGACGKLVTDYKWYAAFYNSGRTYTEGETCKVSFPFSRGTSFDMTVERVISGEGEPDAVILSCDRIPSDFNFTRVQPVQILNSEYTGLRVPVTAVRIVDGIKGVYVLTGYAVSFRKISIITEYEDSYIVQTNPEEDEQTDQTQDGETSPAETAPVDKYKWLQLNENVIVEGKGMYDGRIISK